MNTTNKICPWCGKFLKEGFANYGFMTTRICEPVYYCNCGYDEKIEEPDKPPLAVKGGVNEKD